MLARGLWPDGTFSPAAVLEVLGRPRVRRVLWFTLWSAGVATLVSVVLGLPVAYALHRLRFPGRDLVRALVARAVRAADRGGRCRLPAAGRTGRAARRARPRRHGDRRSSRRWSSSTSAWWCGRSAPSGRPSTRAARRPLRRSGRARGRCCGRSPCPPCCRAIVSAASVVFLFCATAFGVVLTMGGLRYANVETEIYLLTTQELDLTAAAALSLLQLVVIVVPARPGRAGAARRRTPRPVGHARRRGRAVATCRCCSGRRPCWPS